MERPKPFRLRGRLKRSPVSPPCPWGGPATAALRGGEENALLCGASLPAARRGRAACRSARRKQFRSAGSREDVVGLAGAVRGAGRAAGPGRGGRPGLGALGRLRGQQPAARGGEPAGLPVPGHGAAAAQPLSRAAAGAAAATDRAGDAAGSGRGWGGPARERRGSGGRKFVTGPAGCCGDPCVGPGRVGRPARPPGAR